jgi:endonuclease YncB( thermonuclease family)
MTMKTIRQWAWTAVLIAGWFAVQLAAAQDEPAWETMRACRLHRHLSNDGDSFRVAHRGRTILIRLYYVDAPETDNLFPDRVREQADYFSITPDQAIEVGREAARFMAKTLSRAFTVETRWEDAMGAATVPRYFGTVTVGRRDYAELLVENGLARIYGKPAGSDAKVRFARLRKLEDEARKHRRGAWALSSEPAAGRRPKRPN